MKYTNKDIYNGFKFKIGSSSYFITDIDIKRDSCTIDGKSKHTGYTLGTVINQLNNGNWIPQNEDIYEIY